MKSKKLFFILATAVIAGAAFAQEGTIPSPLHQDGAIVSSDGFVGRQSSDIDIVNRTNVKNFPVEVWGYKNGDWSFVGSCAIEDTNDDEGLVYPYWGSLDYRYYEVRIPEASNIQVSAFARGDDLLIYLDGFSGRQRWSKARAEAAAEQMLITNMPLPEEAPDAKIVPQEIDDREAETRIVMVNQSVEPAFSMKVYGIDLEMGEWEYIGEGSVADTGDRSTIVGPLSDLRRYDNFDYFAVSLNNAYTFDVEAKVENRELVIYLTNVEVYRAQPPVPPPAE